MKRQVSIALGLSFIAANTSFGHIQEPISPVDQSEFRRIELPTKATSKPSLIFDSFTRELPTRPKSDVPEAKVSVDIKGGSEPILTSGSGISGLASYYCCTNGYPVGGNYAAAGPQLRVAMGGGYSSNAPQPWKGKTITVCGSKGCASVTLVDWCQCYWKQPNEKLIDLYPDLFYAIGANKGRVTISW